ncbi:MAG TPA: hypothetical protein VD846_02740 [Allosphingosinicella sp.]|nr:hypothetical protein [Allosphingosinicella sp.]
MSHWRMAVAFGLVGVSPGLAQPNEGDAMAGAPAAGPAAAIAFG